MLTSYLQPNNPLCKTKTLKTVGTAVFTIIIVKSQVTINALNITLLGNKFQIIIYKLFAPNQTLIVLMIVF